MIERNIVKMKMKEHLIQEFVASQLSNVGYSHSKMVRTPLGEKIIVYAARPGLVVGKEGKTIKNITTALKKKFALENPQIEIAEVENLNLDPQIVAEKIATSLERFGTQRFKGIGHKIMQDVLAAGAKGIEIKISGKVPSARAKSWRFYAGYLRKCGDVALHVPKAYAIAKLRSGIIGIQVKIMPPDIKLPDVIIPKKEEGAKGGEEKMKLEEKKTEEAKLEEEQQKSETEKEESKKKKKAKKAVKEGQNEG